MLQRHRWTIQEKSISWFRLSRRQNYVFTNGNFFSLAKVLLHLCLQTSSGQIYPKCLSILCSLIHDISLSRIRIRNSLQNYAMKINKKYIPVRVLSTETTQVLLLKPLSSAVPYIPTGLSMYSSQQLLHHLYSSHISSSIQDEQTFAITRINVSQWRVFQTNLAVRKQMSYYITVPKVYAVIEELNLPPPRYLDVG